jgi:hypothetical protein
VSSARRPTSLFSRTSPREPRRAKMAHPQSVEAGPALQPCSDSERTGLNPYIWRLESMDSAGLTSYASATGSGPIRSSEQETR